MSENQKQENEKEYEGDEHHGSSPLVVDPVLDETGKHVGTAYKDSDSGMVVAVDRLCRHCGKMTSNDIVCDRCSAEVRSRNEAIECEKAEKVRCAIDKKEVFSFSLSFAYLYHEGCEEFQSMIDSMTASELVEFVDCYGSIMRKGFEAGILFDWETVARTISSDIADREIEIKVVLEASADFFADLDSGDYPDYTIGEKTPDGIQILFESALLTVHILNLKGLALCYEYELDFVPSRDKPKEAWLHVSTYTD